MASSTNGTVGVAAAAVGLQPAQTRTPAAAAVGRGVDALVIPQDEGPPVAAGPGHRRPTSGARGTLVEWIFTPWGQVALVLFVGAALIAFGALLWAATGGTLDIDHHVNDSVWASYIMFVDPGSQTGLVPGEQSDWVLVVAVYQSVAGLLFMLVVLGIVVDRVRDTCARYRELHYRIIQEDHVVILGWNDKTLFLIRELCNMYDSARNDRGQSCWCGRVSHVRTSDGDKIHPTIIVLSSASEESRVQQLRTAFAIKSRGFRLFLHEVEIIFATGNTAEPDALRRVSLHAARFVMILGDSAERSNVADQKTLRTVLAVQATLSTRQVHVAPMRRLSMYGLGGHDLGPVADSQRTPGANGDGGGGLRPEASFAAATPTERRTPAVTPTFNGTLIAEIRVKESADVIRTIGRGMDLRVVSMRATINATYALHALVPTLGQFFSEIMRYDGNELYCAWVLAPPSLDSSTVIDRVAGGLFVGRTFDQVCAMLSSDVIVIGVVQAGRRWGEPANIVLTPLFQSQRQLTGRDKLVFLASEVGDLQLAEGDDDNLGGGGSGGPLEDQVNTDAADHDGSGAANGSVRPRRSSVFATTAATATAPPLDVDLGDGRCRSDGSRRNSSSGSSSSSSVHGVVELAERRPPEHPVGAEALAALMLPSGDGGDGDGEGGGDGSGGSGGGERGDDGRDGTLPSSPQATAVDEGGVVSAAAVAERGGEGGGGGGGSQRRRRRASLSAQSMSQYTSELLIRPRSFLMIGYPTDMGDYLETFNRFLRLRTSTWGHRGDDASFSLWMDTEGRTQARALVPDSEVHALCVEMWHALGKEARALWEQRATASADCTAGTPGSAGAGTTSIPGTCGPPGSASFQVPLRDSEAHHIYVLADKSNEWRYNRFLANGRPWNAVRFVPFTPERVDGEWQLEDIGSVDETLRRGGPTTTRFGDLLIHHLHGDPDNAAEIEEAIIFVMETNDFGVGKLLDAVLILADCDDTNSLVSDSSTLTALLHVRTLAETLVTIHIRIPDGEAGSQAHRRAILEDLVEHLNSSGQGFDSAKVRFTPDPSGEFRFIRTALSAEACEGLRRSPFGEYIKDVVPVLGHWRVGAGEVSRVVTEVLDIDTDRILRNNPLLRSKSVFFPSNLLETGMFAFNAQSQEVNAVLHSLLGNILYNADLSQRVRSKAVYPIAFELLSQQLLDGQNRCSFNQLWRLLRCQGAVLLGWNRLADAGGVDSSAVSTRSNAAGRAVGGGSKGGSPGPVGAGGAKHNRLDAFGDVPLPRPRKPRSRRGPRPKRRLCINPLQKDERVYFRPDDELIVLLRPATE